jgi:uncharacterized protein (TIGR03118 family)
MTALTTAIRRALPAALIVLGLAASLSVGADPLQAERGRGHGKGNGGAYQQHNLVSDQAGVADNLDANLVNGWGVAFNPNGFVWVADNGTGVSMLYDGQGNVNSLVVTIPTIDGTGIGVPTGITFNATNDFAIGAGTPSHFLFATEDGVIAAWSSGNTAVKMFPPGTTSTAVYKGIAIAANGTEHLLYAADFHNKRIDVLDASFAPVNVPGGFVDPGIPSDFGPFNIMNINGDLYVAYAMTQPNSDDEAHGPGLGFVDVFDANGVLLRRIATRGSLNAPWGMALAPAGFGRFANALLVGNFGDGRITAFDLSSGKSLGQVRDASNSVIAIDGLWGLAFGNGLLSQPADVLFFAAGPSDESHGLYGFIQPVP